MTWLHSSRFWAAAVVLTLWIGFAHAQSATRIAEPPQRASEDVRVTAVSGESWLIHLNRPFNETSMGKTSHLGPASWELEEPSSMPEDPAVAAATAMRTLHGRDIFRMNCQGCHGATGEGAPPEINSVIDPVRATSVPLVRARLKALGMTVRPADAVTWTRKADAVLLQRLHNGGEEMPPFHHLREAEVGSLHNYLRQLAGVPGAEGEQIVVTASAVHVGEQIVKATCHTCHSATGANPTPQQLLDGAIPPLSALLVRKSRADFIRKVIHGAPVIMGSEPTLYRGRMPVFDYLTAEEAADAYLYLQLYPPTDAADSNRTVALSQASFAGTTSKHPPPTHSNTPVVLKSEPGKIEPQSADSDTRTVIALTMVVSFVVVLLAFGAGITMHEFRKLSAKAAGSRRAEREFAETPKHKSITLQHVT